MEPEISEKSFLGNSSFLDESLMDVPPLEIIPSLLEKVSWERTLVITTCDSQGQNLKVKIDMILFIDKTAIIKHLQYVVKTWSIPNPTQFLATHLQVFSVILRLVLYKIIFEKNKLQKKHFS